MRLPPTTCATACLYLQRAWPDRDAKFLSGSPGAPPHSLHVLAVAALHLASKVDEVNLWHGLSALCSAFRQLAHEGCGFNADGAVAIAYPAEAAAAPAGAPAAPGSGTGTEQSDDGALAASHDVFAAGWAAVQEADVARVQLELLRALDGNVSVTHAWPLVSEQAGALVASLTAALRLSSAAPGTPHADACQPANADTTAERAPSEDAVEREGSSLEARAAQLLFGAYFCGGGTNLAASHCTCGWAGSDGCRLAASILTRTTPTRPAVLRHAPHALAAAAVYVAAAERAVALAGAGSAAERAASLAGSGSAAELGSNAAPSAPADTVDVAASAEGLVTAAVLQDAVWAWALHLPCDLADVAAAAAALNPGLHVVPGKGGGVD
jgi:hypothetical protein